MYFNGFQKARMGESLAAPHCLVPGAELKRALHRDYRDMQEILSERRRTSMSFLRVFARSSGE